MARFARRRNWYRFLGCLATLVVLVQIWPVEARAGCGPHYLSTRSGLSFQALSLVELGLPNELKGNLAGVPLPDSVPKPCSGVFCSGNQAPIPAPIPPVSFSWQEEWAFCIRLTIPLVLGSRRCWTVEPVLTSVDHSLAIFHPPRAGRDQATTLVFS